LKTHKTLIIVGIQMGASTIVSNSTLKSGILDGGQVNCPARRLNDIELILAYYSV